MLEDVSENIYEVLTYSMNFFSPGILFFSLPLVVVAVCSMETDGSFGGGGMGGGGYQQGHYQQQHQPYQQQQQPYQDPYRQPAAHHQQQQPQYGGQYAVYPQQGQQQQPYAPMQQYGMPQQPGGMMQHPPQPLDASPWRTATAADGQVYYYNQITQETQWDRPAGM
jgi:hypothetical protein